MQFSVPEVDRSGPIVGNDAHPAPMIPHARTLLEKDELKLDLIKRAACFGIPYGRNVH
jgi:hypothetical protein